MNRARSGVFQTVSARHPPGASTRANSATAASGDPKCSSANPAMTASNVPSANGSASALPSDELGAGDAVPGELDHRLGDVHTDHRRAALERPGGHVPGAGPHVEHPRSGPDRGGVEQRRDQPRRDRREEVVVARGLPLPARRLEGVECAHADRTPKE